MWPLARYTILESIRDQIYLGFLIAMALLVAFLVLAGSTPWGLENFIVERLGWMAVDIILALLTSIYAVNNIYRERDKKILYTHLTLPIGRFQYLAGKALGLLVVLAALAFVGTGIIIVGVKFLTHVAAVKYSLFWIVVSAVLKNLVLLSFVLLFTQVASNGLTASLFSIGVYLVGNGAEEILRLASNLTGTAKAMLEGIYFLVPNLQLLDFEQATLYHGGVGMEQLLSAIVYSGSYSAIAFTLACILFFQKDL